MRGRWFQSYRHHRSLPGTRQGNSRSRKHSVGIRDAGEHRNYEHQTPPPLISHERAEATLKVTSHANTTTIPAGSARHTGQAFALRQRDITMHCHSHGWRQVAGNCDGDSTLAGQSSWATGLRATAPQGIGAAKLRRVPRYRTRLRGRDLCGRTQATRHRAQRHLC